MASMNEKDYYAVLEVSEDASTDEIRRAFQKKARKLHPDVNKEPDAEERFKEVSEAYAVLSDADKRKRYDAMRSGVPFAGGYGGQNDGAYSYSGDPFSGFPFTGTWTSTSTRTRSRSYRPRAGADVLFELDLEAAKAREGVRRGVTYQRYAACDVCGGSGSVEHTQPSTCPTCGGAGRMRIDMGGLGLFGIGFFEVTCPECEGSGQVVADPCDACHGSGRVLTASEVVVEIPENSHDGDEVRVNGMGNAGTNGRESGDFVCTVCVAEERLTQSQEGGMRLIGFGLPFLVLALAMESLRAFAVIGAVLLAAGIAMCVRDGVGKNARWWRHAGEAALSGITSGIMVGLLVYVGGSLLMSPLLYLLLITVFFSLMSRRVR